MFILMLSGYLYLNERLWHDYENWLIPIRLVKKQLFYVYISVGMAAFNIPSLFT